MKHKYRKFPNQFADDDIQAFILIFKEYALESDDNLTLDAIDLKRYLIKTINELHAALLTKVKGCDRVG